MSAVGGVELPRHTANGARAWRCGIVDGSTIFTSGSDAEKATPPARQHHTRSRTVFVRHTRQSRVSSTASLALLSMTPEASGELRNLVLPGLQVAGGLPGQVAHPPPLADGTGRLALLSERSTLPLGRNRGASYETTEHPPLVTSRRKPRCPKQVRRVRWSRGMRGWSPGAE